MSERLNDDEIMKGIVQLFESMNLKPSQLRKIADVMEFEDDEEQKAEEYEEPKILRSNDLSELVVPEFVFLRTKIGMSKTTYNKLKEI